MAIQLECLIVLSGRADEVVELGSTPLPPKVPSEPIYEVSFARATEGDISSCERDVV